MKFLYMKMIVNSWCIFFHTHKQNPSGDMDEFGIQYKINANGETISQQEGFGSDLFEQEDTYALSRFF